MCKGAGEKKERAGRKDARTRDGEVKRRRAEEEEQDGWKKGY